MNKNRTEEGEKRRNVVPVGRRKFFCSAAVAGANVGKISSRRSIKIKLLVSELSGKDLVSSSYDSRKFVPGAQHGAFKQDPEWTVEVGVCTVKKLLSEFIIIASCEITVPVWCVVERKPKLPEWDERLSDKDRETLVRSLKNREPSWDELVSEVKMILALCDETNKVNSGCSKQ